MIDFYVENIENVWFAVAYEEERIIATTFAASEKKAIGDLLKNMPYNAHFQLEDKASAFSSRVITAIKSIYEGKSVSSKFSLFTKHLPEYTGKVLDMVYLIPIGYATTYGSVAKAVGGGPRAAGNVMARNPFAPIVPCHRVVCSDFTLGGYGGGLDVKVQMLERERKGYISEKEIPVNGGRLRIFPVELVLKKLKKDS